ncbi:4-amino-4-deoxy-L-arabinose-phosphoundecaprenol flippase subunit ArnF [Pectobacterium parmentieri]|uniref:Probable 4-amino-4-deoxy-L-arabinose-phosphoundecaprenol flippase subunit ArnF n=1 Tax=Pectobacterium parmentieri TaxID=1905730 RepID=A0A8B3F5T5_PECPM|nr:4-amino-4-deoxy-L-arabinose-phosphoundecaprenol flippase subunit ArnF [Pectobacterium parmentieri]AOR59640.1 4-amino-4-deoxy-L-arabinose-phospho-UDP flippase [Pectobacterium parmentieri]AYH09364.1 4-amino-4-deoxy-L-arabinose-phospho-UDP flippase [Pectobacterium parmentieri]AYH19873.1 4-amino-4-deoxy-L-arabinose-phospho-UDP flippase [Pectobacterium parmentieri]AYH35730.1 4-amino-4-deoxy-L-arabinose-phospho-UDP flippase [Pectobacterium parmentieri]AZS55798.1 4-amino-4-deoxy-L-arabinose-phosph
MAKRGYVWALVSIVLASAAQVLMKSGMLALPIISMAHWSSLSTLPVGWPAVAVLVGIVCYGLSMVCWFVVLRYLPLSRAYPLISLSYAVVYLAAVFLPWLNEPMSLRKNFGVLVILLGVWLINRNTQATK